MSGLFPCEKTGHFKALSNFQVNACRAEVPLIGTKADCEMDSNIWCLRMASDQ
jgi:hypothetical protein